MAKRIESTYVDASSLTLCLYDIIKNSIDRYSDPEERSNHIISRIPEIKNRLDSIITKHCVSI
jgi:hypothetical protein